jgi:hypothetical protein
MTNDYWEKLSFIFDGEDNDENYKEKLFDVLKELFERTEELESKSHMHKFQLLEHKKND